MRQRAACPLQHSHPFRAFGHAQALGAGRIAAAGGQQAGDADNPARHAPDGGIHAWRVQHPLRHLQHVFAHDAGAQQDGQRGGATRQQLFARLGITGQVFEGRGAGVWGCVRDASA